MSGSSFGSASNSVVISVPITNGLIRLCSLTLSSDLRSRSMWLTGTTEIAW